MPFDEEQNTEITTLVRKTLGLEEGKTLADALEDHINDTLNRYDKRKKKDSEGAATELAHTAKQYLVRLYEADPQRRLSLLDRITAQEHALA